MLVLIANPHVGFDTVSGTTTGGDVPDVQAWIDGGPTPQVTPVAGAWSVDFSAPEVGPYDIYWGDSGGATHADADGDATQTLWSLPLAEFTVYRETGDVWGNSWAPGVTVRVLLNDFACSRTDP